MYSFPGSSSSRPTCPTGRNRSRYMSHSLEFLYVNRSRTSGGNVRLLFCLKISFTSNVTEKFRRRSELIERTFPSNTVGAVNASVAGSRAVQNRRDRIAWRWPPDRPNGWPRIRLDAENRLNRLSVFGGDGDGDGDGDEFNFNMDDGDSLRRLRSILAYQR